MKQVIIPIGLCAAFMSAIGVDDGPALPQAESRSPYHDSKPFDALEDWKAHLESLTDGVWITSNEAYQNEDGGTLEYGMAHTLQPSGVAATGCLWGDHPAVREELSFGRKPGDAVDFGPDSECVHLADARHPQKPLDIEIGDQVPMQCDFEVVDLLGK